MKRWLVVAMVLAAHGVAIADVPWAQGVSKDNQTQANALFAEANQLFAQQAHAPALEKYKAAIALWDHPLIEFNMAVTLVRLDRILDAAEALDKALRFDKAPFPTPEQYQQALDYQKLVAGRVGTVEASCEAANVAVLLDGRPWFSCPGKQSQRVLAGEHVIVGESAGYMTLSRRVIVAGGATANEKLVLLPIESVVKLEYPSPRWLPWTVAGAGAAITLGGLGFWFAGRSQMDRFHADFATLCPTGCAETLDTNPTERQLADQRDSANLKGTIGISMLAVGGAITVGGVVWAIINRPKRVMPALEMAPTGGGAAATARWRF
ncbi:MAG TPA: tetratricopeptide repeat protein [Kofleriaceae bacterium]